MAYVPTAPMDGSLLFWRTVLQQNGILSQSETERDGGEQAD